MLNTSDKLFMRQAIRLAKGGVPLASPNPLVGAVLVKEGKVLGEGFHKACGGLHAEREALLDCKKRGFSPEGATLYVTLEPCCHTGRQPPCTTAILNSKVSKVVFGSSDPNPLVAGKGKAILQNAGVEVIGGLLKTECDALNPIFFHWITTSKPFVALKTAQTLDGYIATKAGFSHWITGERARLFSHRLRNRYSAIAVGVNTVLADDPMLNCRLGALGKTPIKTRNPVRIVFDTNLRTPLTSLIAKTANKIPTLIVHGPLKSFGNTLLEKTEALKSLGIQLLEVEKDEKGFLNIPMTLNLLPTLKFFDEYGELVIDSVLIEGGAKVAGSFIEQNAVDRLYAFIAPTLFLGEGKKSFDAKGVEKIELAPKFALKSVKRFGSDALLIYDKNTS